MRIEMIKLYGMKQELTLMGHQDLFHNDYIGLNKKFPFVSMSVFGTVLVISTERDSESVKNCLKNIFREFK